MPKLTKRVIDALRPDPGGAELFSWDSELRGFGVRLMPSGVASYLIQYRTTAGRTRRLVIGRKGKLTPEEARKLARKRLGEVAEGGDPSTERRKIRQSITVAELCDLYLEDGAGRIKASTLAMDRSRIETHVKPLIGSRAVTSIGSDDVERLQADIARGRVVGKSKRKGRGGEARGGRGVASRTVGMLGTIFELARRRKLIKENPARGVERLSEGRQRRFLSLAEIATLGEALRAATGDGEGATAIAAIRLLLLTGLRRMECLALPKAWVDAKAHCIRFGDTKSGAQLRPIGSDAVALLDAIPARAGNPWVFPAERGDGHFVGLPAVLARICKRAGVEGVTVHVLRHTFAAVAAEMGYSELTIAGLLGHSVPGITARYAHVPDSALVAAADRVSARIAAALDGRKEEVGQIVPLRRA